MAQGSLPGAPCRLPGACLALACDSPGGRPPSAMCPVTLSESWARPPQGRAAAPWLITSSSRRWPIAWLLLLPPLAPAPAPRPCSCPFADRRTAGGRKRREAKRPPGGAPLRPPPPSRLAPGPPPFGMLCGMLCGMLRVTCPLPEKTLTGFIQAKFGIISWRAPNALPEPSRLRLKAQPRSSAAFGTRCAGRTRGLGDPERGSRHPLSGDPLR